MGSTLSAHWPGNPSTGADKLGQFDTVLFCCSLAKHSRADEATWDSVLTRHLLFRALTRGELQRPALPPEIVLLIFRSAQFVVPNSEPLTAVKQAEYVIRAHDSNVVRGEWFASEPMTAASLKHIAALRLDTTSHHQGFVSDPNAGMWSWFEVGVSRPLPENPAVYRLVEHMETGEPLVWLSHENPLEARSATQLCGKVFWPDHPLWTYLKPGDKVSVLVCAQYPAWRNHALVGQIRSWRYFEPVLY